MFARETQILQRLFCLVVCHDLAMSQFISPYLLVKKPMSWFEAREFCQRHYIDLTVLSTERQYFSFLNATAGNKVSFWLGLQRQSIFSGWEWLSREELGYDHWYRRNYEGFCASLEAMLKKDKKMLARHCDELHMFVCQGPVSPQPVKVDSVSSDHVTLSWNVSAFSQMTPHSYNVTMCTNTCRTVFYPNTERSAFMNINVSNLTSPTEYLIEISAFVVRPDFTGGNVTLQSYPTALRVRTVDTSQYKVILLTLRLLKLIALALSPWILYWILKKCQMEESDHDNSPEELSTDDTIVNLIEENDVGNS